MFGDSAMGKHWDILHGNKYHSMEKEDGDIAKEYPGSDSGECGHNGRPGNAADMSQRKPLSFYAKTDKEKFRKDMER